MATLAARLANNGTYYVTGSLDDFSLSNNALAQASIYLSPRLPDAYGTTASYIQGPNYLSGPNRIQIPIFLYQLGLQTNFTFETWFYANSQSMNITTNYSYQTPLLCSDLLFFPSSSNSPNYFLGYMFHIEGNGSNSYDKISFRFYGANNQTNTANENAMSVNFPTSLLLNKWYHIAITISNNNISTSNVYMNAYLNGNFIGSNTSTWVYYSTPSSYYPLYPGYFTCQSHYFSNSSANDVYISNMIISSNIKYNSNFKPIISTPDQLKNDPTTIMAIAPVKNSFSNSTIAIFDSANATNISGNTAVWTHQDYVTLVGNSTSYINYNFGPPPPVVTKLSNNGIHQVYGYFDEITSNTISFASSGLANTKAKLYSNGVFAITNTAVFDEVSYPTGSINVQSYNFISTPITWQTDSRFVPGSNNFTIEFWINPRTTSTGTAANSSIMGLYNHSSTGYPSSGGNVCWGLGFATNSSTLLFFYNINGGTGVGVYDSIPSTSQLPLSTWTHVAITRNNKLISMYLNGILNNSFNDTTLTTIQNPSSLIFGIGDNSGDFFNGFLSNVRITMNEVLYTSNFSPPTFQLKSSANTSLLLKTPYNSASSKDFSYNNFGFVFPFSSSNTVPFSL